MPMLMVGFIRILMLTFLCYLRPLVEGGFVYAAQPPLYLLKHGKDEYYCYSDEELDDLKTKIGEGAKYSIQRYKRSWRNECRTTLGKQRWILKNEF